MQEAGFSKSEVYLHDLMKAANLMTLAFAQPENAEGWIAYLVGVTS